MLLFIEYKFITHMKVFRVSLFDSTNTFKNLLLKCRSKVFDHVLNHSILMENVLPLLKWLKILLQYRLWYVLTLHILLDTKTITLQVDFEVTIKYYIIYIY